MVNERTLCTRIDKLKMEIRPYIFPGMSILILGQLYINLARIAVAYTNLAEQIYTYFPCIYFTIKLL